MEDKEKLIISKSIAENLNLIASEMDALNHLTNIVCEAISF